MAALVTTLAVPMAACGAGRSVESYCTVFYGEGQELRQRYIDAGDRAEQNPLGTIGTLLAAPRDLAVFFGKLAEVAPEEIEPDVVTVRDAFQEQADHLGDDARSIADGPLGALGSLAGGLATGLAAGPAIQRVDSWTTQHCGPPPAN
ncbi:MAG: hypothetical protein L0H84_03085 [Pseudonocardia sp.]|nr:hypothetical protein [Pseudonocardia sp.]